MPQDYTPEELDALLALVPGALVQSIETEQAIAIIDTEGDLKQDVFLNGLATDGSPIGQYSTKPIYVSVDGARQAYGSQIPTSKLRGLGKPEAGKKKGNKARTVLGVVVPHQSQYFADGYKGFRAFVGRPVDKVNLKLTGDTAGSIASGTEANVSTIAFTNDRAAKKAEGHEKHFGKTIYRPSATAIDALTERLQRAAQETLDRIFA